MPATPRLRAGAGLVLLALLASSCSPRAGQRAPKAAPAANAPTTAAPSTGPATTAAAACRSSTTTAPKDAGGKEVNPPGDIPDNQAFVRFIAPSGRFRVEVPEGWARSEESGAVSFTDKLNTVRLELLPAPSAPTPDSARAGELPAIRASAPCFEEGKVSTVKRKAGPAVLITYRADSPPEPVTGKVLRDDVERYEFWQDGNEAVITLSGPQGSDNVDPWRRVTDSFAWTP